MLDSSLALTDLLDEAFPLFANRQQPSLVGFWNFHDGISEGQTKGLRGWLALEAFGAFIGRLPAI